MADDGTVQLSSRLGDFCLDAPVDDCFAAVAVNPSARSDSQRWYRTGS
ncbi:hypothetical protein MU0083_003380 [[Mycobacterium] kokjensenii]|uniref:Uncharacterized protein n=1 Tax=[Mycobacterium] kokjensenii TaxID=3064287 RepID=A0ABN9NCW4_9MYCO|nr:hypothetical protein [Mycolicibacter sp. MU0083]CAJ1504213.1 hypothetical protein MU0083_003380 [Mycolicibacter sp. MU0083]